MNDARPPFGSTDFAGSTRAQFADEHDRANLLGVGGDAEARAHLFANWDEVLPQRKLHGSAQPHAFEDRSVPLDITYEHDGEERTLDGYVERNDVAALLVLADGAVVHDRYRLGAHRGTRWHLWSASKSFTSTVVGRALHTGVLDSIDDRVTKYVSISGGYAEPTIRDVLMMSSGVNFFHHQGSPDRRDMYRQIWGQGRDLGDFASELGPRIRPGTDFNYLATDTHVLSMVLRAAYDQPFHQIVQEQLWDSIGMAGDAFWSRHADGDDGHAFGHACLCPRALEFAHLGQFYIQDGIWNGERLLPEGFAAASGSPRASFQEPSEGERGYGYQWWVPWRSAGESMASGAFGQMLWVDIERGVSIAQFGAQGGEDSPDTKTEDVEGTHAAMRAIAAAVSTSEYARLASTSTTGTPPATKQIRRTRS